MASVRNRFQFQGVFDDVVVFTGPVTFTNAATGSGTFSSIEITVPGVALGDVVLAVSVTKDTVDTAVVGAVTAADTVTLTVLNNTAGAVNLGSTTVRVVIGRLNPQVSFV